MNAAVSGARTALADIVDLSAEALAAIGLLVVDRFSYTLVEPSHDRRVDPVDARPPTGVSGGRALHSVPTAAAPRHPFVPSGRAVWPRPRRVRGAPR